MSLTKVNYIDNSTIITAQNLNDIQDNIIELQNRIPLGIEYGGTGATSIEIARRNLEITPENIGALSMELLWENTSPTSAFAEQTINLDLTEYRVVLVTTDETSCFTEIGEIGTLFCTNIWGDAASQYQFCCRTFRVIEDSIFFGNQANWTPGSNFEHINTRNVPLRIYGIKGVSA